MTSKRPSDQRAEESARRDARTVTRSGESRPSLVTVVLHGRLAASMAAIKPLPPTDRLPDDDATHGAGPAGEGRRPATGGRLTRRSVPPSTGTPRIGLHDQLTRPPARALASQTESGT